jgi:5,10-methylenetetrahydromethanopterin reductase
MRLGASFRSQIPPEELASYARHVEGLGYEELWVFEDCFLAGGIAAATVALAATERIVVGIGILPAVMRNPVTATLEIAALARMFPGRVLPGFGHGEARWMRQIGAFPASQMAALGETVEVVRRLLHGETVSRNGRYVDLDEVRLDFPPAVVPPISTGVRGPRSLQLSGRVADGTVLAELSTPAYVRWARQQIDLGREQAGRSDAHRVTVYALVGLDPAGRESVRSEIGALLYQGAAVMFESADSAGRVAELIGQAPDSEAFAASLPDELIAELSVTSRPTDAVKALADAGADTVVLYPPRDAAAARQQISLAAAELIQARPG